MATAVSSLTKIATATAMLAVVLVARTSRLTISKPHACATPEALIFNQPFPFHAWSHPLHLPLPLGSPLITTDTHPATKKITSHERVKGSRRTGEHKSCLLSQISECIAANIPAGRFLPLGFPDSSVVVLCGGWWALCQRCSHKDMGQTERERSPVMVGETSWRVRSREGFLHSFFFFHIQR